jgi:hypothetical protein
MDTPQDGNINADERALSSEQQFYVKMQYQLRDIELSIALATDHALKLAWQHPGLSAEGIAQAQEMVKAAAQRFIRLLPEDHPFKTGLPQVDFTNIQGFEDRLRKNLQALTISASDVHTHRGICIRDNDDNVTDVLVATVVTSRMSIFSNEVRDCREMTVEEAIFVAMHELAHAICNAIREETEDMAIATSGFASKVTPKVIEGADNTEAIASTERQSMLNERITDMLSVYGLYPELQSFRELADKIKELRGNAYMRTDGVEAFVPVCMLFDDLAKTDNKTFQEFFEIIFNFYITSNLTGFIEYAMDICKRATNENMYYDDTYFREMNKVILLFKWFDREELTGVRNTAELISYHLQGSGELEERLKQMWAPPGGWRAL